MRDLIIEKNKYSIDKLYLLLISIAILAPGFGAIDNNAIRWLFLSVISGFYILKLLSSKRYILPQKKLTLATIIGTFAA